MTVWTYEVLCFVFSQALHARMQQSHEQHRAEINALHMQMEQMKKQLGNDQAHVLHQLNDENCKLKDDLLRAQ